MWQAILFFVRCTIMDKCIDFNVICLHSFIAKTSPNVQNSAIVARASNSFATPSASIRHPVRRISLSTTMKRRPIRRTEVLAFVIAAALYACGLHLVSNPLIIDVIKLYIIIYNKIDYLNNTFTEFFMKEHDLIHFYIFFPSYIFAYYCVILFVLLYK